MQDRPAHCTTGQRDPQSEQHQRDRQGINVAVIGNLPNRKGMPEICNHPSGWPFHATQEQYDQGDAHGLATEQGQTHDVYVFADARDD